MILWQSYAKKPTGLARRCGNERSANICVRNVDGQRGWNPECRDSGHCLCGYFPELEHDRAPRPRRSTLSTVAHIAVGVIAVVLALLALCGLVFELASDERRDARTAA
jgi:hypothetical protein